MKQKVRERRQVLETLYTSTSVIFPLWNVYKLIKIVPHWLKNGLIYDKAPLSCLVTASKITHEYFPPSSVFVQASVGQKPSNTYGLHILGHVSLPFTSPFPALFCRLRGTQEHSYHPPCCRPAHRLLGRPHQSPENCADTGRAGGAMLSEEPTQMPLHFYRGRHLEVDSELWFFIPF